MNKIHVIGIGYRPFDKKAREILLTADSIFASSRLFEVFKRCEEFSMLKDKVTVINKVDQTMDYIRDNSERQMIVLLASGDPMFFGIGRKTIAEFGHDRVEIHPDLSSIQLAFARIKETWDDAFLMSLHGGPDPEKRRRLPYEIGDIPSLLQEHHKIAILTDRENNPSAIAKTLESGVRGQESEVGIFVCEKLGYPDERIISGTPEEIKDMNFSEPNVVIIKIQDTRYMIQDDENRAPCIVHHASAFGLREDEITHSRGLITKDEIRAVSIHKLRLPQRGVLWDIGAGSGSVSVEAAKSNPGLRVFAIERDKDQIANIVENKKKFSTPNVTVISGEAPEILSGLPSPDRVFIGGSGGRLEEMIGIIIKKMSKGILVINAVTLETLNEAALLLEKSGFDSDISQVSVSRSKVVSGQRHMSALNPVFIIRGERK